MNNYEYLNNLNNSNEVGFNSPDFINQQPLLEINTSSPVFTTHQENNNISNNSQINNNIEVSEPTLSENNIKVSEPSLSENNIEVSEPSLSENNIELTISESDAPEPTITTNILNNIASTNINRENRNNENLKKKFNKLPEDKKKELIIKNEIMEILPLSLLIILLIFILLLVYILTF